MESYSLKLFISGNGKASQKAVRILKDVHNYQGNRQCDFNVVDVVEYPEQARKYNVFVTPTLIVESPCRYPRFIGDLSEVCEILGDLST